MNSRFRHARLILPLSLLAATTGMAQMPGDFRINEETYATAAGEQKYPSVASSQGGFTVVWQDDISSIRTDVMVRHYDEQGVPIGACARVNDDTASLIITPRPRVVRQFPVGVIGEAFGNSVIVWEDPRIDLAGDIYGQVIRDDGVMIDANFRVNDDAPEGRQTNPAIAMWRSPNAIASGFVVVWTDRRNGNDDIYMRRFGRQSDGSAVASGSAVRVNDDLTGIQWDQGSPRVAMGPLGDVVVVWRDFRDGVSRCYGQLFDGTGARRGDNFRLDSLTVPTVTPSVAMAGDRSFAVVYVTGAGVDRDIVAQRFNEDGSFDGDTVRVNADTSAACYFPEIALQIGVGAFGQGFAIAWEQQDSIAIDGAIHYRTIDGRGRTSSSDMVTPGGSSTGESFAALASVGYGNVNPPPDRTLLVWQQNTGTDYDIEAVVLEQYAPQGSRFPVSGCTGGAEQIRPAVDAGADGSGIVVWEDMRDGTRHIYARRFNRGTPVGGDFAIDDASGLSQFDPDVALLDGGGFVATWTSSTFESSTVRARRFDASGRPLGNVFDVAAAGGSSSEPSVAATDNGGFAIVYTDTRDDATGDIHLQRFAPDGSPLGASIRVNTDAGNSPQSSPAIARRSDGAIVVAWTDDARTDSAAIVAQAFDGTGARFGSNVRVDDDRDTTEQALPSVAFTSGGSALVAWLDMRNDRIRGDIYARILEALAPVGSDFRINDVSGSASRYWPELPHPPSVAAAVPEGSSDAGSFIVAWTDYRADDGDAYTQRVDATGILPESNRALSMAPAGTRQTFVDIAPATRFGETLGAWSDDREQRTEGWSVWGRVAQLGAVTSGAPEVDRATVSDELSIVAGTSREIEVRLVGGGRAIVRMYAIDGTLVATLLDEEADAGTFRLALPPTPAGAYAVELVTPRRMVTQLVQTR